MRTSLLLFLSIFLLPLTGQDREPMTVEFGTISDEDRQLMTAPGDTSADAYVLYDALHAEIVGNIRDIKLKETSHRRIKLLRPSSFERANIELFYRGEGRPLGLDAVIHLPGGGGYQMEPEDFKTEKLGGGYSSIKFAFPKVEEGAVIEVKYHKISSSIFLPGRYDFQEGIPVRYAEYRLTRPEFIKYADLGNTDDADTNSRQTSREKFGGRKVLTTTEVWGYHDLPAFSPEPYTNNVQDYQPFRLFQLESTEIPGYLFTPVLEDWEVAARQYWNSTIFGRGHRIKKHYKKAWKTAKGLIEDADTDMEKITTLYNFVSEHVEINDKYAGIPYQYPDDTFDKRTGTSADKTFLLMALLYEAGIPSTPVLVRRRGNGRPIEDHPVIAQFDLMVAQVYVDGRKLLLDPNTINRPPGLPRLGVLNHRLFVADQDNPEWIDYEAEPATETFVADIELGADGMAKVILDAELTSYFAFNARNREDDAKEDDEFPLVRKIAEEYPDINIQETTTNDQDDKLELHLEFEAPIGEAIEDFIYVRPILIPSLSKELVQTDKRKYPVDFPYPWVDSYTARVKIPAGYVVDELPEAGRAVSESGEVECSMEVSQEPGNVVLLKFDLKMAKSLFAPDEYEELREIFGLAVGLQESTIVLKKQ